MSKAASLSAAMLLLIALPFLAACSLVPRAESDALLPSQTAANGEAESAREVIGAIGLPFLLEQGQTAIFMNTELRVRFTEVLHEERCPQEAACEWAGYATIGLAVSEPDGQEQLVELSVEGPGGPYGYENEERVGPYLLRLEELNPYPKTLDENLDGRYLATVLISREEAAGGS